MIGLERWVDIVALHRRGMSIRAIARHTKISRNAVRRALRSSGPPQYQRESRPSKLDPYKAYIDKRLEEFPDLTATKLLREIQDMGYDGKITILRDYTIDMRKKRKSVSIRFETLPGVQTQCDFTELGYHEIGGIRLKLYIFVMVLGYSRMSYAQLTLDMASSTLLSCHESAFSYFGGVTEHILYDNPKTVVNRREGGQVIFNAALLDFAGLHGFEPRVCKPYRAKTKGKVERFIGYLKDDFLTGETFAGLDDMQRRLIIWLDTVANTRVHDTTKRRPIDMFVEEKLAPSRVIAKPSSTIVLPNKSLQSRAVPHFTLAPYPIVQERSLETYEELICL